MSEIIINTSPDAARFVKNISGWVSRNGRFYGDDEITARWDGCTHVKCEDCGRPTPKSKYVCDDCRGKRRISEYNKLEKVEWDGTGMVYSTACDHYFCSLEEASEYADDTGKSIEDLRLVICEPVYPRTIDPDYWEEYLADDGELPIEILTALDALNKVIEDSGPTSYTPGKKAVKL